MSADSRISELETRMASAEAQISVYRGDYNFTAYQVGRLLQLADELLPEVASEDFQALRAGDRPRPSDEYDPPQTLSDLLAERNVAVPHRYRADSEPAPEAILIDAWDAVDSHHTGMFILRTADGKHAGFRYSDRERAVLHSMAAAAHAIANATGSVGAVQVETVFGVEIKVAWNRGTPK